MCQAGLARLKHDVLKHVLKRLSPNTHVTLLTSRHHVLRGFRRFNPLISEMLGYVTQQFGQRTP